MLTDKYWAVRDEFARREDSVLSLAQIEHGLADEHQAVRAAFADRKEDVLLHA